VDPIKGKSSWVTIGAFDGVHLGHQKILSELTEGNNERANAVTFFPHPGVFLNQISEPYYLSTPAEQKQLLQAFGVDEVLIFEFDQTFSRLSPRDFIQKVAERMVISGLLIGYDFRMGADRAGDHFKLKELGKEFGFNVSIVEPVLYKNKPISSSRIRDALKKGLLQQANEMLGYPFSIAGEVVHGDGRGRHIGLPTANIQTWPMKILPNAGVYAALVDVDNVEYRSVVSIGYRPTFYKNTASKTIEVHILDFSREIYGKNLRVHFLERLRAEEKYDSVEKLMEQIKCDIINADEIFSHAKKSPRLFT